MKEIIIVCFFFTVLWSREYPHITYDSNTRIGKYELVKKRVFEPKILKSTQNIVLNGSYKIIGGYGNEGVSNFKNGRRQGKQIRYVPMLQQSSVVKLTSFYKNGKIEGEYTKHRHDGRLLETGVYKNNIPVGIERQYSGEGNLLLTIEYLDGVASLRREYNTDSSIKKEIFYNKNACKEKVLIYEENGSIVERTYANKVRFDANRLSKVLALAYETKSCTLEENIYENVIKKYYYAGERFRNLSSEKSITWENVQKLDEYNDAIYSNGRLVESSLKENKITRGIAYFDENGKLRKSYEYDEGISVYINNKDGSKDIISCRSPSDYRIHHYSKYELGLSDSHGFGGYWEGYMHRNLQYYEYKYLIRKDKLKEHAKLFFDRLKREVLKNGDLGSRLVRSQKIINSDDESRLELLHYFDEQQRIMKIIDFKSKKITMYHYFKDAKNHKITCYYTSGSCVISEHILKVK